jgi:hypothetical protein
MTFADILPMSRVGRVADGTASGGYVCIKNGTLSTQIHCPKSDFMWQYNYLIHCAYLS